MVTFLETVDLVAQTIEARQRVSYRALQLEFELDDGALEDVKNELVDVRGAVRDVDGKLLEWAGGQPVASPPAPKPATVSAAPVAPQPRPTPPLILDSIDPVAGVAPHETIGGKARAAIWLGAILVIGGAFLPWARSRLNIQVGRSRRSRSPG